MTRTTAVGLGLFLLGALAPLATAKPSAEWNLPLPRRAFAVEGGHVALQGGITRNSEVEPAFFGNLRYPTRYFLVLRNETDTSIYADVTWLVPDTRKITLNSDAIPPGGLHNFWRGGFGVKTGVAIPFTITVYADKGRTRQLGVVESELHFEEADRKAFLEAFNERKGLPLISGWREMRHPRTDLAGSAGSPQLQRDIQLELWERESIRHRDCEHQVGGVEAARAETSAWLSGAPEDVQRRAADLQTKDAIHFEVWQVKSCEETTAYHLAMVRSPGGGTDFIAMSGDETRDPAALLALMAQADSMAGIAASPASRAPGSGTPSGGGAGGNADFMLHEDHRDQFTIELPRGWSVSDQAAKSGKPGPFGVIVFSSESMSPRSEPGADRDQFEAAVMKLAERQDSGEMPSFYVDRHPSKKGSSCARLSEEEKASLLKALRTSAFGADQVKILEPVRAQTMSVGGCHGLEVLVRAASTTGEDIHLLVRTVSDGTTSYDFALRNRKGFFETNQPTFDRAVASVKLAHAE
jgi:hypothetical protein